VFSNKSKIADVEWKIKTFQQGKKHIADFMIEFEVYVKIVDGGLCFYFFSFHFILFFFSFFFSFLFLEQLGLVSISHAVTSVTN